MLDKKYYCLFVFCLGIVDVLSAQIVLPTPQKIEKTEGYLSLDEADVSICTFDTTAFYLRFFQKHVLEGKRILWEENCENADIYCSLDSTLPQDGYILDITKKQIKIAASNYGGFLYAVQTLRQWVLKKADNLCFKCSRIVDTPRVIWRCFMLDSGRQFQRVATLKKYIDMASILKMNYFHWHLTEGLGWRVDIKKYPRLTQIGSNVAGGAEQQGYYTHEDIKELVCYAEERNVTIVPEIDMPGHAEAALFAYPQLGCFKDSIEIPKTGFTKNIFCAGKDSTIFFLKGVLDEVCSLFPSAYIHLGGDEAPKENWNKCSDCQRRIKSLGLHDAHDLQLWLSAEMAAYLGQKGKKVIFWGDVVYQDGYPLPDNVIIQWWNYRGHKELALHNALRHNYPVICSTNTYCYLNFPITPWRGYRVERTFDFRDVYLHNPSDIALTKGNPLILGMTTALWTDYGVTEDLIDCRLFPRIFVLAEQMWYQGNRISVDDFYYKVLKKKQWFEDLGYRFGPAMKDDNLF